MTRYENLIDDLRQPLRPQRDWSEGRGLFLVLAHFAVGLAAGGWLASAWFGVREGMLAAWALAALGGLSHLAFLGRPERFWRMALRLRTSWVSRGFAGLTLFLLGGALYLVPATADAGLALALAGAVVLAAYMGFVYAGSKAIPFWSSPLHPALYAADALRGGVAMLLVVAAFSGAAVEPRTLLALWSAASALVVLLLGLELHAAARSADAAARRSVRELLRGRAAPHFLGGALALGLVAPAILALHGLATAPSAGAMAIIGLASALGDLCLKYSTLRAGVHRLVWSGSR